MVEENSPPTENFGSDLVAFQQVASAFQQLDHAGRIRLLKTIATFFKLEASLSAADAGIASQATATRPTGAISPSFSEDRTPTPKDFLRDKRPKTDVERVTALAYYLTHYRGMAHFKTVDLSQLNTEAAQVKFSNPAQAVDNATKAGLLVPAVKGAKQLSAHGELYVQALPDRDAARAAVADARPRRRRRSNAGTTEATAGHDDRDEIE